ncbi:MAG: DUF5721 family protein [Lachnospiraceae bacterium]|nr:DUF5721 family protein [Lachnospiraceae bacterium]
MIALQFEEIKPFMNKLLADTMFHNFILSGATIVNGVSYTVEGHTVFSKVQPVLFSMVKGSETPSYMKMVFSLSPENIKSTLASIHSELLPEEIGGMFINITFQDGKLFATTGVSYAIFTKDHALEGEWDRLVKLFFTKNNLFFETLS